jgi:hypothetical protein
MKLFCPACSTSDPIVEKIHGIDKKSWKQHIAEVALWLIPVLGTFIQIGTTITDFKGYNVAICGKCKHKWDVKNRQ